MLREAYNAYPKIGILRTSFSDPAELNAQRGNQREDVVLRLVVGNNDIRCSLHNLGLVFYFRADEGDGKHDIGPELGKGESKITGTT